MGDGAFLKKEPFRHLPLEARRRLETQAQEKQIPAGAVLFREGDPAEKLWIICSGWVRLVRRVADGQNLTIDLITPKERFCGLTAFTGGRFMATAVAGVPVTAICLPVRTLVDLMQDHAELAGFVARLFDQRYNHIVSAYTHSFVPVPQRLAAVLLRLEEDFGSTVPVTRRELADMSGTTVETAIRVTRQMQKEGILQVGRGRISILRPQRLAHSSIPSPR